MHLAQDNDVVYTLTPDRSDQPFGKAVLPGRGRCDWFVPDAHGTQSACDDAAIDPIPIADEVTRRFWFPSILMLYRAFSHERQEDIGPFG
jgi:hypothetical protein